MWTALDLLVIAVASTGALVSIIWLDSVDAWWAEPVATYLIMLILAGGSVSAYGGCALDDMDDARAERKVVAQLIAIALGAPLLIVLGKQALGVPLEASPGRWPAIVDTGARVSISCLPAAAAVAVIWLLARRARREWLVWISGSALVMALLVLAAWPWLPSSVPTVVRGAVVGGPLLLAVILAKRLKPPRPTG